ncbi:HD domain-containing protein [Gulosibacter molinativorax]|uniref:Metal-dependent phosphohydrolase n=1 Tax=Gulosibacter molinativorax TaxID=256821 RepID=A0ABT7C9T4_9MICO|nr:hypothetical protein [Gulosibacter molinativorax]MDJ1371912.1 metal-dependent phosphohydrolase [Gulosibacter molinativorax]QUY62561.1 Hypotetical protein [Gulosibacter molinativorax]
MVEYGTVDDSLETGNTGSDNTGTDSTVAAGMQATGLPQAAIEALLTRWREPHRNYHGETHLTSGLEALERLGGTRLERIAFWCHDAVHTNTSPDDELASVEVTREVLGELLPASELEEVCRLILVTIHHTPEPGDASGARIADADLVGLGYDWEGYRANIAGIRVEPPQLTEREWRERRIASASALLRHDPLFHTDLGHREWEPQARENLARELAELERT